MGTENPDYQARFAAAVRRSEMGRVVQTEAA